MARLVVILFLCLSSFSFSHQVLAGQLIGDVVFTTTNVNEEKGRAEDDHPSVVRRPAASGPTTLDVVLWNGNSWNTNPRFSWDKTLVVFASGMAYGASAAPTLTLLYYIPNVKAGSPSRVTTNNEHEYNEFAADWSPDDSQLVIEYAWHSGNAGASESNTRLGTVDSNDNTSFTPIMENTHQSYNDYCARWHPTESNYILFVSDRGGKAGIYLYDFRKDSAQLIHLPEELAATDNCPFWDQDGHKFHYEVARKDKNKLPFMASVNFDAPALVPIPEFTINYVNTPCCSGVTEYTQCNFGPSPNLYSCLRSGPMGDSIVIINDNGELVQNVTPAANNLYHDTPNWK